MKKIILSLLILSVAAFSLSAQRKVPSVSAGTDRKTELPARGAKWVGGPGPEWEIHYEAALARAAAEHRKVYVLSTGSDWCGWCIKLRNDVLTNSKFRKFAKKNLVLLYLDSPKKKKLPPEQQKHNIMVRSMLKFGGGVPSAKVLDEKGRILAERSGYAELETYMDFLNQAIRATAEDAAGSDEKPSEDVQEAMQKAEFRIIGWGESRELADKPLDASNTIRVPVGARLFFKFQYDLPKDLRAMIWLRAPGVSVCSPSGVFQGRGETIQFLQYDSPAECTSLQFIMKVPGGTESTVAEVPCRIIWDAGMEHRLPKRTPDWQGGPGPEWEIHYEAALARAKSEHKKIFVLSTGSDWCVFCISLRNNVLTNPQFRKFAKKNLVLLYLDNPRKKKLSEEQALHNARVRSMLKFGEGVPAVRVLDENGRILAKRSGQGDLDTYMDFLKQAVRTASPKD